MAELKCTHFEWKGNVIIPLTRETVKTIMDLYNDDKAKPICLIDSSTGLTATNWKTDVSTWEFVIDKT